MAIMTIMLIGSDADLVFRSPYKFRGLVDGLKFSFRLLADRADPLSGKIRKLYAFLLFVINVTANTALIFHSFSSIIRYFGVYFFNCDGCRCRAAKEQHKQPRQPSL